MAYQGKFSPKNPSKYEGNHTNIIFRSSWEALAFKWCDENNDVVKWSSEEFFIPYYCPTDSAYHRYFVDLKITYADGKTILVEIKPHAQTVKPVLSKGKRKKTFLVEAFTYEKNAAKWTAAIKYANERGWSFKLWTENTLRKMGIRV